MPRCRSQSCGSGLGSSFAAASATLRHQRNGSPHRPTNTGASSEPAGAMAAPAAANPYAVFMAAETPTTAGTAAQAKAAAAPTGPATANPYASFAVADAESSVALMPAGIKGASKPRSLSVGDSSGGGAPPSDLYERFLQPLGGRGPSVEGWVAPAAGARDEVQPTAAASLEAVALLAAQAPPDVEVRPAVPLTMPRPAVDIRLLRASSGLNVCVTAEMALQQCKLSYVL